MGKKISHIAVCQPIGYAQFLKEFALSFAVAFRYYITGLIIGYFLCVTIKKCYTAWSFDRIYSRLYGEHFDTPSDENRRTEVLGEDHLREEDGEQESRNRQVIDRNKRNVAPHGLDASPSMSERPSVLDYWKQCFDNFGFVVVDSLNPVIPLRSISDTSRRNLPRRALITSSWEPRNVQEQLVIAKSNKSSSTTDIPKITPQNVTTYSQVKSSELISKNIKDCCVDTLDLEHSYILGRPVPKQKNKKLDTSSLNLDVDKSVPVVSPKTPKSSTVVSVTKKLSTTDLENTVKSSLIPGKKVSKDAVIVLRLRDRQSSNCNLLGEEGISIHTRKPLSSGNKKTNKSSFHGTITEKRNYTDSLKLCRVSRHKTTSDDDSSENLKGKHKKRKLVFQNRLNKNGLRQPSTRKKSFLSEERFKNRITSRKNDVFGKRNTQSLIRHSSKQIRPKKTDTILQPQDFSKRQCFKYKTTSEKRHRIIDSLSKQEIRSLNRFLTEFRNPDRSNTKQSVESLRNKKRSSNTDDVYRIEVKGLTNGLRIRSRSMGNKSFNSKREEIIEEASTCKKRNTISKTNKFPEPKESIKIGKVFGNSTVSIGISSNQTSIDYENKSKVSNGSETSTGSETASIDEIKCCSPKNRKAGNGNVEELIVAIDGNSSKNNRGQFWKIFGSKNSGK